MPTLYLTDEEYQVLEQESQHLGLSIKEYIIGLIPKHKAEPKTLAQLFADTNINSFQGDPVQIQRKMRDEWE